MYIMHVRHACTCVRQTGGLPMLHLLFCHMLCIGFTQTLVSDISGDYALLLGPAELLHLWQYPDCRLERLCEKPISGNWHH